MRNEKQARSNALGAAAAVVLGLAALPIAGASASASAIASVPAGASTSPATAEHSAERAETLRATISNGNRPWLARFGLSGISAVGFDSDTGETAVLGTEYVDPHAAAVPGLGMVTIGGAPATVVFQTGS